MSYGKATDELRMSYGKATDELRIPKAQDEVALTDGVYLRRRLKVDGQPECAVRSA